MAEPTVKMCRQAEVTVEYVAMVPDYRDKIGSGITKEVKGSKVIAQEFCQYGEEAAVLEQLKNLVEGFCGAERAITGFGIIDSKVISKTCAVGNPYKDDSFVGVIAH